MYNYIYIYIYIYMNNIPLLIYTNSEYNDVFEISLNQIFKFAEKTIKYVLTDKLINRENENIKYLIYDNSKPYITRLLYGLEQLNYNFDYVLLHHDWAILYDNINQDFMDYTINYIRKNNVDQLRLISSGINIYKQIDKFIYDIDDRHNLLFSVQPALWKVSSLIDLLLNYKECSYRNCEFYINNGPHIKKYKNFFFYNNEPKFTNAQHCYSTIYPHIHATHHGKWCYNENKFFIDEIIVKQYNIDLSIRGLQ